MRSRERIVVRAPAKVNLYLAVKAARDDGYHDVDTVLQAISLADDVAITPAETLSVTTDPDIGVAAEDNLAYRAAMELALATGRTADVAIHITKRIPAQAGLGGASSDAAAVLLALAHLWDLGQGESPPLLRRVAGVLGADVPFFLGSGTALLTGRGDDLVREVSTPNLHLALVKVAQPVSTAQAYAEFDRMPATTAPCPEAMVRACESGEAREVAAALFNGFSPIAERLVPEVADALAFLSEARGTLGAMLAGSGSAVFALCESEQVASGVVADAHDRGWWAESASSVRRGACLMEGD